MVFKRLRRNRATQAIRNLVQETHLSPHDLVAPFFIIEGNNQEVPIKALPGHSHLSIDKLLIEAEKLHTAGVQAICIFPVLPTSLRSEHAEEAYNENSLIAKALQTLKRELPSLTLIPDIALDPYTTHGHDGIVNDNLEIDNDATLNVLAKQALCYANAGADIVAPSDMMDGRVLIIRDTLDAAGYTQVGILSYAAKFASNFYSPFRQALQTKLSFGDKSTYQLNPANKREAVLEALTDEAEGADMLMVKPALPYLDILSEIRHQTELPLCAYHVSGEYAMVMAAHEAGYLDADKAFYEIALSIKRAGADFIFTYAVNQLLRQMSSRFTFTQLAQQKENSPL
ncbi:MAG: Delta-aminolevulinic acid dehydratase [Chlamydiia bacterium]|nr:Delta-aminolevulinic acid dehydratase [Chlamydiia bacterium]MCH9616398.1 Delta-aminolevulinic acid dehydratase [Chlamydiia bacterium]MCH9629616.1 Delta-aminolevulinic acid dehydratase [Chlamydiia bacterium]